MTSKNKIDKIILQEQEFLKLIRKKISFNFFLGLPQDMVSFIIDDYPIFSKKFGADFIQIMIGDPYLRKRVTNAAMALWQAMESKRISLGETLSRDDFYRKFDKNIILHSLGFIIFLAFLTLQDPRIMKILDEAKNKKNT